MTTRNQLTSQFNLDLEKSILGGILTEPQALRIAQSVIKCDHFYAHDYRRIFAACERVVAEGGEVDIVTVGEQLRKSDTSGADIGCLSELENYYPTAANLEYFCKKLLRFALKRELSQTRRPRRLRQWCGVVSPT